MDGQFSAISILRYFAGGWHSDICLVCGFYLPAFLQIVWRTTNAVNQLSSTGKELRYLSMNSNNKKSTHDSLQEKGGVILGGADDTYILGPPQIAFPKVKFHEERLASIGLKLNYSKMKCYIKESKKSEMYHELREAANIPEGFIEGEDGTRLSGLRAYGVQSEVKSSSRNG